jgi:mitochondrial fission protein ELM1
MHFRCEEDVAAFVALIGQPITALTKYLCHPVNEIDRVADLVYVEGTP